MFLWGKRRHRQNGPKVRCHTLLHWEIRKKLYLLAFRAVLAVRACKKLMSDRLSAASPGIEPTMEKWLRAVSQEILKSR